MINIYKQAFHEILLIFVIKTFFELEQKEISSA